MSPSGPNRAAIPPARRIARLAGAVAATLATIFFPGSALAGASPSPSPPFTSAAITLSTAEGPVGTELTAAVSGFPPDSTIAIYVDGAGTYIAAPTVATKTGHDGTYRLDFAMPDEQYGAHLVCADTGYPGSTETYKVRACTQFSVVARLTVDPASGDPGTRVRVVGTGFPASALAGLYIEPQGNGYFGTPGPAADSSGRFDEYITWPISKPIGSDPTAPGAHSVCANTGWDRPGTGVKACATFTVKAMAPSISLEPSAGQVGTELTVKGGGFPPSARYGISIDDLQVICGGWNEGGPQLGTDTNGALTTQITLYAEMTSPCLTGQTLSLASGRHKVCVQVGSFNACGYFTLLAEPTAAPAAGGATPPWMIAALAVGGLGIITSIVLGTVLWMRRRPPARALGPQG